MAYLNFPLNTFVFLSSQRSSIFNDNFIVENIILHVLNFYNTRWYERLYKYSKNVHICTVFRQEMANIIIAFKITNSDQNPNEDYEVHNSCRLQLRPQVSLSCKQTINNEAVSNVSNIICSCVI